MGLLDNLINAVQTGVLEDRLNQFADAVDATSGQVNERLGGVADKMASTSEKLADAPGKVLEASRVEKLAQPEPEATAS